MVNIPIYGEYTHIWYYVKISEGNIDDNVTDIYYTLVCNGIYTITHKTYYIHTYYIYSQPSISRTRKGPGKVSDLSDIKNIMQIRHEMRSAS